MSTQKDLIDVFYQECHVGRPDHPDHRTSGDPFGVSYNDPDGKLSPRESSNSGIDAELVILKSNACPSTIEGILLRLGESREATIGGWTIMSATEIIDRIFKFPELKFVDFATKYCGMGHIVVASWRKSDGKCFIRESQGANGYEQASNDVLSSTLDPDTGDYSNVQFVSLNDGGMDIIKIPSVDKMNLDEYIFNSSEFIDVITNGGVLPGKLMGNKIVCKNL